MKHVLNQNLDTESLASPNWPVDHYAICLLNFSLHNVKSRITECIVSYKCRPPQCLSQAVDRKKAAQTGRYMLDHFLENLTIEY